MNHLKTTSEGEHTCCICRLTTNIDRHINTEMSLFSVRPFRDPALWVILHEGGGQGGDGVEAVDESEGGANQGIEGLAKDLVGHPGTAKGDAPDVCIWILQRCPCCPYISQKLNLVK